MNEIKSSDLIDDIYAGKLDEHLVSLRTVIGERLNALAQRLRFKLNIGQSVWFNHTCRPAYMRGAEAKVVKINRERVVVNLVKPAGRFHHNVTCPLSILTLEKM